MIRAINILRPSFKASLHMNINMKFMNQKIRDLDELGQRSYIAQIIMRQIEKSRSFQEIKQSSLTQHIIDTVQQQTHIKQEIRKEMLSFFKQGINLDFNIFAQEIHRKQIFNTQLDNDPTKTLKLQNTKIRYFPTTLISQQVFSQLRYGNSQYQIITGHSGISKSLSIQLFWYLSNIVCEYRCKEKSKLKLKQNTLLVRVPKIIYWNVIPEEDPIQTRKKILKQFFEIGDNLEETIYLKQYLDGNLIQFYKKHGIEVVLVVDQFNLMVNLYRDLTIKATTNNISKSSNDPFTQIAQLQIKQQIQHLKNCLGSLFSIRRNSFSRFIYLSAVPLQKQILKKKFTITRRLGNVASIVFKRLRFEDLIYTPMALYELIDYFMFELKQKINLPQYQVQIYNNLDIKKKIRDMLYLQLRTTTDQVYLTPLLISQNLRLHLNDQKIMNLQSMIQKINAKQFVQNIADQLKGIFESCLDYSEQNLIIKVKQFLQKGNQQSKKAILSQLFIQSHMIKKKFKKNKSQIQNFPINDQNRKYQNEPIYKFQMDEDQIVSSYYSDQLKQINDFQYQSVQSNLDKKLFYYDKDQKKIYSYFQYFHIQKYLGRYHQNVIQWMLSFSEDKMKYLLSKVKENHYFQNLFIEIISSGYVNVSFPKLRRRFLNIYGKKIGFVPIPQLNNMDSNYCFLNKFRYSFENLPSQDHEIFVYVPLKQNLNPVKFLKNNELIGLDHIDDNSQVIDLIIVQVLKDIHLPIKLFAIDFTVSADEKQVQQKFYRFIEKYKKFNDKDEIRINGFNRKIKMRYFVMSAIQDKQIIQNILNKLKDKQQQILSNQSLENQLLPNQNQLKQKGISPLLQSIGHIYMGKENMILSKNSSGKDKNVDVFQYFDRLGKIVQNIEQNKRRKFDDSDQDN